MDKADNKGQQGSLHELRDQIDKLDKSIMALISERAWVAQEVAKVKLSSGSNTVFYRPEREAQVLRSIMEHNPGPLGDEEMARLFREIMSACLALEQPVQVAYLGPEGTFTQQAAFKHFGQSAICHSMPAIDDVFREVEAGAVNYGVVPVENSSEGVVTHTLDSFLNSSLQICGEVVLRIHHHLLSDGELERGEITRIYSHAQSLAQCRKWLDAHCPRAERIAVSSNAEAARRIKSETGAAAIAGDMAAQLYDLHGLAERIEDQPDNSTRFLIIGNESVPVSGEDKTSLLVAMRNKPGSLHRLLAPFHCYGVDLTRIETRPARSVAWNYVFFIDFIGHQSDPKVVHALKEVEDLAVELKILGSYPRGVL